MNKYVFSGSLTNAMHDMLLANPKFRPLDILVTQVDRSGVKQAIEWKKEGFCRWFFLDSGAFSVHTGKANTTVDEYIDYINSIDEYIDVCAELDTIPGKFGQPKSKEDYEESARLSWESYLYMRSKVKSPDKVMPVFHFGESFEALNNMLTWRDENGNHLQYIGISPANDASMSAKNVYLQEVSDFIKKSENPDVKTHLYGYTALDGLSKYPCYSADSISHRLIAGYAKVLSRQFGVISLSDKARTSGGKSGLSFLQTADALNLKKLEDEASELGFTLDQLKNDSSSRVVFNILNIQELIENRYKYSESNVKRPKPLFKLPN